MSTARPLGLLANAYRDAVVASVITVGGKARLMPQEEIATALTMGVMEALGILMAEIFKHDRARLVEVLPRCEEILRQTTASIWSTGHLPDCGCSGH